VTDSPNTTRGKGEVEFIRLLADRFPHVAANISEVEAGLLHLEISMLAKVTRHAIETEDWDQVRAHFEFVDELMADASPELENAIYVSYLENVLFGQKTPRFIAARRMLSRRLEAAMIGLEEHWSKLVEADRRRRFP
jgi:hypothetical protein